MTNLDAHTALSTPSRRPALLAGDKAEAVAEGAMGIIGALDIIDHFPAAPRAATEPDYLDGARDAYQDELRVRRLLTYLWNATGYRSENLRVRDMFADDDPLVADVEAALNAGDKAEAPLHE